MRELRRSKASRFEDQDVFKRVGEMVLTSNDVIDLQVGIVSAGSQVIRRHAIAPEEGKVFDIGGELGLLAVNAVHEPNLLLGFPGDVEAQGEWFSGGGPAEIGRASCRERV